MMREFRYILVAMCCTTLTASALGAQMVASPRADTAATDLAAPRGPVLAPQLQHSDPGLTAHTARSTMELGPESSRMDRAAKGALWGLGVYALMVGGYLLHESITCETSCYGEGWAPLAIVVWTPVAIGTGAVIGFALPPWR